MPGSPRHAHATFDAPVLNLIDAQRSRFQHAELAPHTVLSYERDWRVFSTWCEVAGRSALPASPDTLRLYMRSRDPFKGNAAALVGL